MSDKCVGIRYESPCKEIYWVNVNTFGAWPGHNGEGGTSDGRWVTASCGRGLGPQKAWCICRGPQWVPLVLGSEQQ